ncbi:MAG: phosphomannomutase/phosphoglucomutase [Clostridiales bacterium]|nr:phosphomannomutase/phosphoglucomutase [Candidatus Equinaster intestinalis]
MDYSILKSGTDVRGVASDKGGLTVNLTESAVYDITAAAVVWFCEKFGKKAGDLKVTVGHDSRITAQSIALNVIKALTDSGVNTYFCSLCSTPAMFMTTIDLNADMAVQITASHHPFDRNGLKFFTKLGGLDTGDLSEILELASEGKRYDAENKGLVFPTDYMPAYAKRLRDMICNAVGKSEAEKPLNGYHIIVDAGNGAGGFYANDVLAPLGADISGSQFLEPDGMFPNHIPNPENKTAMESICAAVKKSKADLGIIFDTDVDRAGCVDSSGEEINRNRLVALASFIALQDNAGGTVVTDSVTSDGLKEYINTTLGGVHYRYKRGYKNVINKAVELCNNGINCPLAIETSGHAALRENYFLDDGAYLATKIVIELARGRKFEEILKPLKMPAEEKEIRLNIKAENFHDYGMRVIAELESFAKENKNCVIADDNREGMRITTPSGWMLLRLSVHDPVMPINFESEKSGGVAETVEFFREFYEKFDELDLSSYK